MGKDQARAQVLALVRSRVNLRFSLAADAFADRVLTLDVVTASRAEDLRGSVERLVLDDLYLATACAAGDNDAWREVERTHFAFIRDFAARFLRGAAADDLAADVLADLWQRRKIAQFAGRSSLRTWLGAVVTRSALNAMAATPTSSRQESIEPAALTHAAVAPHDGGNDGLALARFVRKAVDRLDAESKLRYYRH